MWGFLLCTRTELSEMSAASLAELSSIDTLNEGGKIEQLTATVIVARRQAAASITSSAAKTRLCSAILGDIIKPSLGSGDG